MARVSAHTSSTISQLRRLRHPLQRGRRGAMGPRSGATPRAATGATGLVPAPPAFRIWRQKGQGARSLAAEAQCVARSSAGARLASSTRRWATARARRCRAGQPPGRPGRLLAKTPAVGTARASQPAPGPKELAPAAPGGAGLLSHVEGKAGPSSEAPSVGPGHSPRVERPRVSRSRLIPSRAGRRSCPVAARAGGTLLFRCARAKQAVSAPRFGRGLPEGAGRRQWWARRHGPARCSSAPRS